MAVTAARDDRAPGVATQAEIERVRNSGVLGRSGRLLELFDYLVSRSGDEMPPKEIEIALAVFGKADADAVKDDPVARVYVHRLRKRLDDFYLRDGAPGDIRLTVPKGEYRVVGRPLSDVVASESDEPPAAPLLLPAWLSSRRNRIAAAVAAVAVLLIGNVAAWAAIAAGNGGEMERLQRDPLWAGLSGDERPLVIVVGDYYMFGEYQAGGLFLNRLVRDFAINSREDLLEAQRGDPEGEATYSDVNLRYLPVSIAFALTRVMKALPEDRDVRVLLASEVTPDTIRDYDIVYIGLLSGLTALRSPAFAGSRFAVGSTYDELVDTETGERYVSEAFMMAPDGAMHRDYGYVASFDGPRGNHVLILAGARDPAVMGVAESVTRASTLAALHEQAGGSSEFDALYEILGQRHISLESSVLAAAARDSSKIWVMQDNPLEFPSE